MSARSRVAVVEDDELIRTMLRLNLEAEGYAVEAFGDAETFLAVKKAVSYDLVVLDILLPGTGGHEVLRAMRRGGQATPVLVVTAKRDLETRVQSLDGGADDYLAKPFELPELLARVRALIRRSQGERSIPSHRLVRIGSREVNLSTRAAATRAGAMVLTERETALVDLFVRNLGATLTRADILEEVWGLDADPTPRTVDNYILRLRRLFEDEPRRPRHFLTVRSVGYRFVP